MGTGFGAGIESMVRRRVKRVALAAGAANAFAFAWQNPEDKKIIVTGVELDITTAGGTATAVIDVGPAANATSTSDTLIDGADANAAALTGSPSGTDGKRACKLDAKNGTTDYITGQILVAAAANLAGYAYITYEIVED